MSLRTLPIYILIGLLAVVTPSQAYAADSNVGNEVVDAANTSLTRTGAGTAANPYKLHLNVGNANTWTGAQTFNASVTAASGFTSTGTFTASGVINANNTVQANGTFNANGALNAFGAINLGDGGDAASFSGTTVTVNTGDNNANSFLVQQGTIKYLHVNTINGSENVAFGNTTTNPTFNFLGSGATNFAGGVTIAGNLTAANNFNANGASTFAPSGTNDITLATDGDSRLIVAGLQTATGNALCLNASNEVILCSAGASGSSLQEAYNGGNIIASTNNRDIDFNLVDTATDSNFAITLGAENTVVVARANNTSVDAPAQLLLLENQDTDLSVAKGLVISAESGGLTNAIDVSDPEIVNALAVGTNDINGMNWSIIGATGNIQTAGNINVGGQSTLMGNVAVGGDVAVNDGDITTTATTANLFNTNATMINIGSAASTITIGAMFGNTVINNGLVASGHLTALNAVTFNPMGNEDITFTTDADSNVILNGLQTATGEGLCIDASNNVIKCSGTPSDRRLKKNITNLTDVLPRVLQAQGVRYDLLKEAESAPGEGKNIGFIAQELEVLFPEVVKTDANGIKSVDYEKMTAVLVESTKEQQKEIDQLKAEVAELKALITEK